MQRGLREVRSCDGSLPNHNLNPTLVRGGLSFDPRLTVPNQDQQTALGPSMLHSDSYELLDQPGVDHFTRKCLRGFHYSLNVQLPN